MTSKITPVEVISFTKISVALACTWPPSPDVSKYRVLVFNALWYICYVSSILLLLPLFKSVYEDRDPVILAKSVCLSCAVGQVTIKMIMCRMEYARFQMLYHEMEMFCKQANDKINIILQRCVDDRKRTYGVYALWCYLTAIGVICGPLFLPQQFPTDAKYPFSVQYYPLKIIIYLHQSLVGLQASAGMCIDCTIALLLFYSSARLEILALKVRSVKNEHELDACIELHNQILRYTTDVIRAIRPLIFTTITTTAIAVIFGSLILIANQPMLAKIQYIVVVFSASMELFVCAVPADNLMHMSTKISLAAYESRWSQCSASMQRKVLQIIFRSQKPAIININGILPALSLQYYAMYLYTSFSYFTAVRMIMNENILD